MSEEYFKEKGANPLWLWHHQQCQNIEESKEVETWKTFCYRNKDYIKESMLPYTYKNDFFVPGSKRKLEWQASPLPSCYVATEVPDIKRIRLDRQTPPFTYVSGTEIEDVINRHPSFTDAFEVERGSDTARYTKLQESEELYKVHQQGGSGSLHTECGSRGSTSQLLPSEDSVEWMSSWSNNLSISPIWSPSRQTTTDADPFAPTFKAATRTGGKTKRAVHEYQCIKRNATGTN